VVVSVAPTATALERQVQAGLGHTAHLVCRFTGHPDSISWYHAHTRAPVIGSRYSVTRYIHEDSGAVDSRLSIERVTRRDYGSYRCRASNVYSSTDDVIRLSGIHTPIHLSVPLSLCVTYNRGTGVRVPQFLELGLRVPYRPLFKEKEERKKQES